MEKSKVYYIKNITSDNLIRIYESLKVQLSGKVGVKVSTGEDGAKELQERIDSRLGRHILEYAESLGLGSTNYELIEL